MRMGGPGVGTFLDGAKQIVMPPFVSLLCICIVFVSMFFLTGVRSASGLCRSTRVPDEAAPKRIEFRRCSQALLVQRDQAARIHSATSRRHQKCSYLSSPRGRLHYVDHRPPR
jgi:hypothetical protein